MKKFYGLPALLLITGLTIIGGADPWFKTCDKTVTIATGGKATVNSLKYPANYVTGSSCRTHIKAPQGFTITATCNLKIYRVNGNCASEYFYVMKNGSKELLGAEYHCGTGVFTRTSTLNTLTLAYTSGSKNVGQFSCSITTNCDCGWDFNNKIVGGNDASKHQYISMAGIVLKKTSSLICGGAIISPSYVVSAAHCFANIVQAAEVQVLVGDHNYSDIDDTNYAILYGVSRLTKHTKYNTKTKENDIAILKTSTEIQFSVAVGPTCLPYGLAENHFDSKVLEAPGWGATQFGGSTSKILKTVNLNTISNVTCKQTYPTLTTNQICTYTSGKDTCQGDSGGSLYFRQNKLYAVCLVSYGKGCASVDPAVNTKIWSYLDWIKTQATGAKLCGA